MESIIKHMPHQNVETIPVISLQENVLFFTFIQERTVLLSLDTRASKGRHTQVVLHATPQGQQKIPHPTRARSPHFSPRARREGVALSQARHISERKSPEQALSGNFSKSTHGLLTTDFTILTCIEMLKEFLDPFTDLCM